MKGGPECNSKGPIISLEQWPNITLFLRKTYLDCISLEQKSCQVYFSVMHETRVESGKETSWSQTLKNWWRWTHRKCQNRKEVETSFSRSQMEQSKSLGANSVWEHPPWPGTVRNEARNKKSSRKFRGMEDSIPSSRRLNPWWWGSEKWLLDDHRRIHLSSSRWTQSQTVHAERRNISYSKEVHRRYQNNMYITGRFVGEKLEDYCNVDGEKELSDAWTSFTRFILLNERPPDGKTWSRCGRLTRKQTHPRPDIVWPDVWNHISDTAKKKAKQRWAIEKPKLDKARQLRGIFFIEPDDEAFQLTMKAARKKLEVPMPAAMPCKTPIKSRGEPTAILGNARQNTLVDADESTRPRLEGAGQKPHQDQITAKGMSSITHYSLVHKFIPMPQASKISDAKAAVEKEWEKWENSSMAADESQKQERSYRWSKEQGQKSSLCVIDESLSS